MTKFYLIALFSISLFGLTITHESLAQNEISLSGEWNVMLDPDSLYYKNDYPPLVYPDNIALPGTTDEAKLGFRTKGATYGMLTRAYKFIGPVWYQKQIHIPVEWENKNVELFLERVMWESTVFIDQKEVSTLRTLYAPHKHNLGILTPGTHTLAICVNNDMVYNIGDKGSGYTEHTQSIWNGIIGRIELIKQEDIVFNNIKVFPNLEKQILTIEASIENRGRQPHRLTIKATLKENRTGSILKIFRKQLDSLPDTKNIVLSLTELHSVKSWDENNPELYNLKLELTGERSYHQWNQNIGFRTVSTTKNKITVNNNVSFIRGNLDCVHFPITGYPSCNEKDWITIFQKYKDYGLNMVRFHSWCPPEAAFSAADKIGIYIQAEILWTDQWMSVINSERPFMNTKGLPKGLGYNPTADSFLKSEMKRIIDTYGNHPSFMFFCIGNELGSSNFDTLANWIQEIKKKDPRRLYAASTARSITPIDDFIVTHHIQGKGNTYKYSPNKNDADLEQVYGATPLPIIAHEVGQVPVYPNWNEIEKYTGVLKARNLEQFKKTAIANGIRNQDLDFQKASGALQQILYKNLIENILLAPSSAGFQMLGMTDYQGQGEALVGWLDCFWDSKQTFSPETFRQYCNSVVPLIQTSKFTYSHNDNLQFHIKIANYGNTDIQSNLHWAFIDESDGIVVKGKCKQTNFKKGAVTNGDTINLSTNIFPQKAGKYKLRLYFQDYPYRNSWDFFIFPDYNNIIVKTGDVYIANIWDTNVDSMLMKGGKVLLLANRLGNKQTSHSNSFMPLFWSHSWFPGQNIETLGSWINNKSALFRYFPTENFTNWQWYDITHNSKYFKLDGVPLNFKPLVQPIPDFHINEKLGTIFEGKVSGGRILVCGYDLNYPDNFHKQLLFSIIEYMKSPTFQPEFDLSIEQLKSLFQIGQLSSDNNATILNSSQDTSLNILAANKMKAQGMHVWKLENDHVISKKGYGYRIKDAASVNKNNQTGWTGENIRVEIEIPSGLKGNLHLFLSSLDDSDYSAQIKIEGRLLDIENISSSGKWIRLFLMREDTIDGSIEITIQSKNRNTLLVKQLVIIEDQ